MDEFLTLEDGAVALKQTEPCGCYFIGTFPAQQHICNEHLEDWGFPKPPSPAPANNPNTSHAQ